MLIGNYRRVSVRVAPIDGSEPLDAFTLTSEHRDPTLRPSDRYMALLIEGAEGHGLPPEYITWLRSLPADPESLEAAAARRLIDRALKKEPR